MRKKEKKQQNLTENEFKKVNCVSVKIENFVELLRIDVSYWIKVNPKFSKNMLACLRFEYDDDFVSEEDEKIFLKGYARVEKSIDILWYNNESEWLGKISVLAERKPEAVLAILEHLERLAGEKIAPFAGKQLADWVIKKIKERQKEYEPSEDE